MIAAVREGKLISMEGDYDHIVNRGSLCVKGISMFATHASLNRLTTPRYRPPGSDHWEEISWDDAIARVAQKIRKTRDATWIATEKVDDKEVPVRGAVSATPLWPAQHRRLHVPMHSKWATRRHAVAAALAPRLKSLNITTDLMQVGKVVTGQQSDHHGQGLRATLIVLPAASQVLW